MKTLQIVLVSLLILLTTTVGFADEPPCDCEFTIESANGKYSAKVAEDSTSQSDWQLTIYQNPISDKSAVWATNYLHDGYPLGRLSDDGKVFVYVNGWYYDDSSIVNIYRQGKLIKQLKGNAFNISANKLVKTVSHQLWLNDKYPSYELVSEENSCTLTIYTIDNKKHKIDCISGEFLAPYR